MQDTYGRRIKYLRLSVIDSCNLKCCYCFPESVSMSTRKIMTRCEIAYIVRVLASLGIQKVRITGGEPLIRPDIVAICEDLSEIVQELCITTNGTLLEDMAGALVKAGVSCVNISLDTLSPEKYRMITGCDLHRKVMRGIDAALCAGFRSVKINAVLMKGINDSEITELVSFAREQPLDVRFIEIMPVNVRFWEKVFMQCSEVLKHFPEAEYSGFQGTAEIYTLPGAKGRLGLISPVSCKFCSECTRLRLTSDGKFKPCLYTADETSIEAMNESAIRDAVMKAINQKPKHRPENFETSAIRTMTQTGG